MRTIEQAKTDLAAVVGRWQVDDLHEAHRSLIDEVLSQHRKVIVFIGIGDNLGSTEDPLDFPSRAAMILQHYPDVVVLPIKDNICDEQWSKNLDTLIRTVSAVGSVTLYGGRDSFVKHYTGTFKTIELDALRHPAGTDIRQDVGREVRASSDFRAGVIYSTHNQYPRQFPVVDIAIVKDGKIFLGKKAGETTVRFPGGYVDGKDGSYEAAARRECVEETGLFPEIMEYLASYRVPDYRMGPKDHMMTTLFLGTPIQGAARGKADDDLASAEWYDVSELRNLPWYEDHREGFEALCKKLGV